MTDLNLAPESGRDQLARRAASEQFETASSGGNWMIVAGLCLSILWIGGAVSAVLSLLVDQTISSLPTALLVAGGIGIFIPAGMILMASFMARTNKRSAASNALVLEAASRLMAPAREAGTDGIMFAEQMKQSASEIDKAMNSALSTMKSMSTEIGDERMRLESVTYASADNARDLTQRLASERSALEALARDLRTQITGMNEAIPRQAQLMIDAARQAGDEVGRADETLAQRLEAMHDAGQALSTHLVNLDALAQDAATRTETLNFAVSRIEEKLDQSRRTVDMAVRAGETAAAAASTTGDSLQTAVSSALENARRASDEINGQTRAAAEEAARTLAQLRDAAEQAAASVRTASHAARAETDMIERRLAQVSNSMHSAVQTPQTIVPRAAEPVRHQPVELPQFNTRPEPASNGHGLNGHRSAEIRAEVQDSLAPVTSPTPAPTPKPAPKPAATSQRPMTARAAASASNAMDDELFDAAADALVSATLTDAENDALADQDEPLMLRRRFDDDVEPAHPLRRSTDVESSDDEVDGFDPVEFDDEPAAPPTIVTASSAQADGKMGWKDIITDMSRDEDSEVESAAVETPQDREDVADNLIKRLESSGISLPEIVKPKAKRKIAEASRKGEQQRRAATMQHVGKQVERVNARLRQDAALKRLAQSFVDMEETDALTALEQTQKTSRNASPRLAAYLLLDAAL